MTETNQLFLKMFSFMKSALHDVATDEKLILQYVIHFILLLYGKCCRFFCALTGMVLMYNIALKNLNFN